MTSLRNLIALGGWLRSGKDAFADRLVEAHGWLKTGMGELILEHVLALNPWIRVTIREGLRLRIRPGFHRARKLVARLGYVEAKTIREFRTFMQLDGVEAGRNFFGEDIWITTMRTRISTLLAQGQRVAFTGVRFPNELAMANDLGALTLWVDRPGVTAPVNAHDTERSITRDAFQDVIDNDGTLADLHEKADRIAACADLVET